MGTFRGRNLIEKLVTKIDEDGLWEKEHHLKRNQYLKVHGSKDLNLYYVLEGSVIIFLMDAGEEQIIRFGYQGDFVAALDSFISEGPSELYIRAIRATSVRSVPKSALMTVIGESDEYAKIYKQILEAWVIQQMERERDLLTSSPAERYQRVLKRSPHLFQEVPHRYIASYLRMTPETLSRIKKS